jgi:hypothetical protein
MLMKYFSSSGRSGVVSIKKRPGTHYAKIVFLHPMIYVGPVVLSGVSEMRNMITLFFMLKWTSTDLTKSAMGYFTPNLCFCKWWDLRVTKCILVHRGREMSTHYSTCSSLPGAVSIKSTLGYVMSNLCFCILFDLWVT